MITLLYILMALAALLILHSYVFYPWYLSVLLPSDTTKSHDKVKPIPVKILMAAHNEEAVIGQKLQSIYDSDYPSELIQTYIGDDMSQDATVDIVRACRAQNAQIHLVQMKQRMGKPAIINLLAEALKKSNTVEAIWILTDANVLFDPQMISELVYQNSVPYTGLVGAQVLLEMPAESGGISHTENRYNNRELRMKNAEGELWGTMMGPFGACFSMRSELWEPVPTGFIVDDFWICMNLLQKGWEARMAPDARAYEEVLDDAKTEYKRKVRMSTGNLQNLKYFRALLHSSRRGLSFAYWSHKVLRWATPVLMSFIYLAVWIVFLFSRQLYELLIVIHTLVLLCVLDLYLEKWKIKTGPLRALRHFLMMNLAMLEGYRNYYKNRGSQAIWEPTKRK